MSPFLQEILTLMALEPVVPSLPIIYLKKFNESGRMLSRKLLYLFYGE